MEASGIRVQGDVSLQMLRVEGLAAEAMLDVWDVRGSDA